MKIEPFTDGNKLPFNIYNFIKKSLNLQKLIIGQCCPIFDKFWGEPACNLSLFRPVIYPEIVK